MSDIKFPGFQSFKTKNRTGLGKEKISFSIFLIVIIFFGGRVDVRDRSICLCEFSQFCTLLLNDHVGLFKLDGSETEPPEQRAFCLTFLPSF